MGDPNGNQAAATEDVALLEDIRLLGRVLGDTLRKQEGEAIYNTVEGIRQVSVRLRRGGGAEARAELERLLGALPAAEATMVVRAFSYFSQLANMAEDQHLVRTQRALARTGAPPDPGSMARALERVLAAGVTSEAIAAYFDHARIVFGGNGSSASEGKQTQRLVATWALIQGQLESARVLGDLRGRFVCPFSQVKPFS